VSVRGQGDAATASTARDANADASPDLRWFRLAQSLGRLAANAASDGRAPVLAAALEEILSVTGADGALVAAAEAGTLTCVAQAGAVDGGLGKGKALPLRWRPSATGDGFAFLSGRGAQAEPLAEYLRAAGFQSAAAVAIGEGDSYVGVLLVAARSAATVTLDTTLLLATAIQPLAPMLATRADPMPTGHHQSQLEHSQKLEALGSMAGMIAHDFNNLLTTILGYTSILKNSGHLQRDDAEFLGHVEEATHRAADLTARLLAFARGGVMRTGPLDLRAVVIDTLRMAAPALQNRVAISSQLPAHAVPIDGDDGQLQQCLLNILLNARDAMPDGGNVEISLDHEDRVAALRIADDGPGMDDEVRQRIFEPYFTTKPTGSGTGLGLSIAYGVMRAHGGDIQVDSARGEGTTFTLRFPTLPELPPAVDAERMAAADRDLVLVVDDDDMVRRTTMQTIAHLGYNVVEAPSGRFAIELLRARPARFAVVLLDLVMPELTGAQTFRELRSIREDLPIVICTGYAADAHLQDIASTPIAGLIHKPFTPQRIEEVLAELMVRKARD